MLDNARPSKAVLVIEDDVAVRYLFERALIADGFSVVAVGNGRQALKFFHSSGRACLIIMDLRMPIMDGWTFRRHQLLDDALCRIPALVVSGESLDNEADLRPAAVLRKPISLRTLIEIVRRLTDGP